MVSMNFNIDCRLQHITQISNFKFHLKSIGSHDYNCNFAEKKKNRVQTLKCRKLNRWNRCNFETFPLNNIKFAIPTVEQPIFHLHTFVTLSTALRWHSRLHNASSFAAVMMTPPRSSSFPCEMWKATILALVQQWELFATSKRKARRI